MWEEDNVEWDKKYKMIVAKVIEICEEIADSGEETIYKKVFDSIFEYVEDEQLYLNEGDYYE